MANINRDYLIVLDAKSSVISEADELKYYITDEHSQNLFVNLVVRDIERINKYVEVHDPEKYQLELHIVKPNNDIVRPHLQANLLSTQDAIYAFELPKEATDYIGTYKCELRVTYQETDETTITTSNKFKYKVKRSIYNDLDSIQDAPQYPVVIQLLDKLSDINQYEEDRRANELARQLAEQQRQNRFDALDADMVNSIQAMDDKVVDVENRITAKEEAVDTLIVNTKADIDEYKVAKDQEIDDYKTTKDTEINNAITAQDNKINTAITTQNNTITQAIANQDTKIDTAITAQNDKIEAVQNNDSVQNNKLDTLQNKATIHEERITATEVKNTEQDNRLDIIENTNTQQNSRLTTIEDKNVEQDNRLNTIEAIDVAQNTRLDAIEAKNTEQDDRLLDIEKVNKRQDMNLKCLFAESKNNMIDVTEEGNSIYLQNSTVGYTLIDEIQGNTMVNCNKEADKELVLNGNINTQGYGNITLTEGVDGGLVDVALEGNTMVNVCDQKDPVAITKSYTVETGNHVALQGEYDGKCRPVVTGNTLWIDNDTEDVLTAFDNTKNLRLQSSFEDKVVTQEMVDAGEESAENLGKYKVDYVISKEDGTIGQTKTFYLNSPLLEGDTIEQQGNNVVHVHRYAEVVLDGDESWNYNSITKEFNTSLASSVNYDSTAMSDKFKNVPKQTNYNTYPNNNKCFAIGNPSTLYLRLDSAESLSAFKTWLQQNPTTVVYKLATPTYEIISQNDTILCDSYTNGHLDVDSAVPIERVVFKNHSPLKLKYIYPSMEYIIQFESDSVGTTSISVGGKFKDSFNITKGINKVSITTLSSPTSQYMGFNGIGFNASNIVVTEATDQDFGYFEGMKSVGECEDLEVKSINANLFRNPNVQAGNLRYLGNGEYVSTNQWGMICRIDVTPGEKYTLCYKIKSDEIITSNGTSFFRLNNPNGTIVGNTALTETVTTDYVEYTSTFIPNYAYVEVYIRNSVVKTLYVKDIMIIKGEGKLYTPPKENKQQLTHEPLRSVGDVKDKYVLIDGKWYIERKCGVRAYQEGDIDNYITDMINTVYPLSTPTYEPIDYNPFTVYSDTTHISNNSTIPANMVIKNTGYNCLLKPNTTYTVSSNLGLNLVTTPSTLTEDCLRFYDTDTSTVTTMKDVTILEGDYTTGKPIPSHFAGIESAFEQEYDAEKGKYIVNVKVANEDKSKENNITFYINEPLRGVENSKDKVFIKEDKVVVKRNCGIRPYKDGDFGTYLTDKVNTVYPLAEPTYEEVEYNDVKLFIESFKNSTLFYNSNVPVTSKLYYSYSVPIVDTVAKTASISDEQDVMIIDLATQVAVMEMMLM